MSRSVVAPDRVRWQVGRQWLPFRVSLRGGDWREWTDADLSGLDFFDSPSGFLAGLAIIATAMLLFLVVWPVVAIALELVLVALILVVAVAGRVLSRRPWTIFARSEMTEATREHTWQVVGWRPSARLSESVVEALESGAELPAGMSTAGPPPRPIPQPGDGAA